MSQVMYTDHDNQMAIFLNEIKSLFKGEIYLTLHKPEKNKFSFHSL
jgi:hypothetical protein